MGLGFAPSSSAWPACPFRPSLGRSWAGLEVLCVALCLFVEHETALRAAALALVVAVRRVLGTERLAT